MQQQESFGQRVRQRRRSLDLTQDELARRVGCAAITVRRIEAGDLRPSQQIAERLAMALAIPLDERAEFVRAARAVLPGGREPAPTPTPQVAPEEIGLEDLSGRAIRGYALGERIGSGGFGAVYRAVQPLVEREVAIKIILPQYANHPDFIRRFEAEAQLVARLEHPHIVPLYDYWREPGVAYLVMRLLRGGSADDLLHGGPLPLDTVYRMIDQIGGALHAAHRAGVIHRDLKPANVLLDEDQNAYLVDFGIAKNLGNPNLEDLTQIGAFIGSPAYSSPEQIRADPIRPQADIYSLGVMMYELLTGARPFMGPTPLDYIQQHLQVPLPPLSAHHAGLPAALDTVIARATAKDPLERYPDVLSLLADLKAVISGQLPVISGQLSVNSGQLKLITDHRLLITDNPYKGLRAFGEADAADFFGRESLTQQLLARLGEGGDLARFLAVVGPSGSGKSSVVRAGLVPALRRGGLPGSENWFIVDVLPGPHPLEELEAALLRVAVNPPESLLAQLREDKRGLVRAIRRTLPADEATELVLVVDQFEEVFTLVEDEAERAHLLDSLVTAALDERSRVRILVTLRADFIDRPLRYVDFGELLRQRSELVLPLTPDEMERAIAGPAERVGLALEPGLPEAIVADVSDQPGALPLLQYALTELFEQRDDHTLTKAAYHSIGGVRGALGRRAEEVYASLNDAEQPAARQLFLRLVTLGEGTEDTRRRVLRSEIESLADPTSNLQPPTSNYQSPITTVIESFGKSRLLSFDRDLQTRGPTVEVAHEALLREWPRLREWLDDSRADVRMQRSLAAVAAEWNTAQRDTSFLLTGAHLEQFEGWAAITTVALTGDERAYLDSSLAERERTQAEEAERQRRELEAARKLAETEKRRAEEQTQSANRLRIRNRVITAVGAIAIVLAVIALVFGAQSNQNAVQAEANLAAAQAAEAQAVAERGRADEQRDAALAAQATAEAERQRAETERRLAASRELAVLANSTLETDPELSILLAMQALATTYTKQAEEALHRALQTSRIQRTLAGHTDTVEEVAYSPDGTLLATSGQDRTVRIWNVATGQERLTLPVTGNYINRIAFHNDGTRLATLSAGENRESLVVTIWDVISGQELSVHALPVRLDEWPWYSISPDWRRLIVGFENGTAEVWDISAAQKLLTLSGHDDWLWIVDFSPDGTRLITGSRDGVVKIWTWDASTATAQELRWFGPSGDGTELVSQAVSPNGQYLAFGYQSGLVQLWDMTVPEQPPLNLTGHERIVQGLAFSPDGARVATGSQDGLAKVWDVATGENLFTLAGHHGYVLGLAFSPDATHLATASTDGAVRIWDANTAGGGEWLALASGQRITDVDLSPDEQRLALGSQHSPATVWDINTGELLLTLSGDAGGVYRVDFSPDGTQIATAGADNVVRVWNADSGETLLAFTGHGEGQVGGLFQGTLDVSFSPDGTRLATAGADGVAKVWDAATGEELLSFTSHTDGLTRAAFSPDGARIVTASDEEDTTVKVWDALTGEELFTLSGHPVRVWGLAFSPDGSRLATAGTRGVVKVWNMTTGEELYTLPNQVRTVLGVAFSPEGERLVTGGGETTRIWDVATGEEVITLSDVGENSVALSADGKRLFAGGFQDGVVRVFVLPLDEAMALARSRVTRSLTTEECQRFLHVEQCP